MERVGSRLSQKYPPLFGALPPHGEGAARQIDAVDVETAKLTHSKPAAIQHLKHSIIPPSKMLWLIVEGRRGRIEELLDLTDREHFGKSPITAQCREHCRWVDRQDAGTTQPGEIAAESRRLSSHRRSCIFAYREVAKVPAEINPSDPLRAVKASALSPGDKPLEVATIRRHRVW